MSYLTSMTSYFSLHTLWMRAHLETIACKFGRNRAICLVEEVTQKVYRRTEGQTTDTALLH